MALVIILATVITNLILADALSCSSPDLVLNIKAAAGAISSRCDEKYCDLWVAIEIGYRKCKDLPLTWITLLQEHNDELDSDVTKIFNASAVFACSGSIPAEFVIRATVHDDDGGGNGWSQTISNTNELFSISPIYGHYLDDPERMDLDNDYYFDWGGYHTSDDWDPQTVINLTYLRDVLDDRGSFISLRPHLKYECLVNECNAVDLRLVMRINAVVALKELCDPGSSAGSECDIWMKIEIGLMNRMEHGSHAAAYETTTWRTMLEEHDSVINRQISRVFRGSTSFKTLDEMPEMYMLKITVRDDDDRREMWGESFNTAEPVVQFTGQFEGPKNGSDIRQGYRLYHTQQTPFMNRRRRGLDSNRYSAKGLSTREEIVQELKNSNKSFVEFFVSTEKECTTNSQNRYYVRNCVSNDECHDNGGN